ncbi:hypothetical protein ACVRXT_07470 [Streptococcus lutetiensis]|uniref:Phage minor structural protein n=1 Tax=Streptococcus lutetiensis TaxID=150055 RepID=A0AB38G499_9STRE|nr:hypothetical protein [Streptococcus lutetiensis]QQE30810.1 hypothetical protein I6H75_00315 [Streptococcus lutetiensis]SQF42020.1 phage minor structural protein [Streptococcus lutetiensis]
MKLIASNQMTLTNLKEKAIERTGISFWHGLSATKHPLGVYDCGSRDHAFANEFDVVSGKKYTVRIIAQRTKGAINLKGGIWYTERTSGYQFDGLAALTQVGELSEDRLGIWERTLTVPNGKIKGRAYVQLEQSSTSGFSTAYRVYDAQVFDENGQPLVTDQNNFGALTSPMAAPDGTYIWKRTITHYTDGTNDTVWEYSGVGEKGNTGANGQTSHVHFAFADNATGGGFSLTTPKAYMGWYADFNEAASTDPTKYRWSKWKGDQGLPGKPGADGKTSYFHMAYADSADGRTGFSFKESGQQYQGYYTDFVQANSTDPTKYAWMDRRAGVEVSGRNLWIQSKATGGFVEETLPDNHITGQKKCYRIPNNKELSFNIEPDFSSRLYRKVTFSAWVKYENVVQGTNGWNVFNCFKHSLYLKNSSTGATSTANYLTLGGFVGTSDWKYITYTYDYAAIKSYDQLKSTIRFNLEWAKSGTAWVTGVMVQFGNVATGHVWAPEDIQADIDSKADQTLTQEQLNALAEKNNLIKAEMEAKASIDTVDKWITAYENYVKANDADKAKSEQALKEASERILGMRYEVNDLKFAWDAIDRFMSFQNEGLIIGKKDGSAYAKFSDDRISLFSGSSEVMYISQGTLNIANGIFTKTIQIGRFRFETHPADADMLVLRYLGG